MNILGNWITDGSGHPFYTRKNIMLRGPVQNASAKVCGLGQFVFSVNGHKAGDHELDPGWTDYRKVIEYVTFDVTDLLHEGDNALGAEIGNGWFLMDDAGGYSFHFPPFMPPNPNPYKPFGKALIFAIALTVTYSDGTEETFHADGSWKTAAHEVLRSNVYGSEIVDASLRQKDYSKPDFDDSAWSPAMVLPDSEIPQGRLINQFQPPVRVIHTYEAKYLREADGRSIYDFGQNMSGILSFRVKGRKGDVIRIYPAEKPDERGGADQMAKGWMLIDTVITYTIGSDDAWETFREQFTYFAGRILAVEKSSPDIQLADIQGHAITSAWKDAGSFSCDDERYNRIYDIIKKAVEANMVSVHTDCPTIERFAWQEPNHLMAPSIFYMKDGKELWNKFLLDMRMGQHTDTDTFRDYEGNTIRPGDGLVPSQCPCYIPNVLPVPGMGSFYDIIPWGSSIILGTRWHYLFYGDRKVLEENYEAGGRYLAHLKRRMTPEGFINHGLGDWGNPDNELARENIETAFLYADAKTMAEFAEILGKTEDMRTFRAFAEEVKENYNRRLLVQDKEGRWVYRSFEHADEIIITEACEALPLYWGMVPAEKEKDVVGAFRRALAEKNSFASGEVGLPYIIQTARTYGMNDLIAEFITREEHPSYYAFVMDGLTTLGEYWEPNPRSHCHDMMGHIVEWFYNGIAGICPLKPGFREVLVKPWLPASVNHLECAYRSAAGEIRVKMDRTGEGIDLIVNSADGVRVRIDRSLLDA
ncbi:MAG: family 78 glycoside hydrolase catalytic domain [Lachnospiraceae bacterium]|nr:family 78 glycoside hydrolase catalytic domain [Lachnospiraceae bacterium]